MEELDIWGKPAAPALNDFKWAAVSLNEYKRALGYNKDTVAVVCSETPAQSSSCSEENTRAKPV